MSSISNREKAFDFAQDVTKQLITLAIGIVALTITFIKDIAGTGHGVRYVEVGWGLYLASVVFGIATLLQLAGNLEKDTQPSIYKSSIAITAGVQILLFLLATLFTIIFGVTAAGHLGDPVSTKSTP